MSSFSPGFISPVEHRCFTKIPKFLPLPVFQDKQHGVHEADCCDVLGVGGQGLEDEVQTWRVVYLLGNQVKTDCLQWSKQTRKENILPYEWEVGASLF